MADHSHIEWTEATWNPIAGCSVVSPGCTNCYAMRRVAPRLSANPATPHYAGTVKRSKAGPVWTGRIGIASDEVFTKPLRWKRPRMIFVNSTSDLFHEDVPDAVIDRVFAIMALCPQHTFQVLTKRAARMREYLADPVVDGRILLQVHRYLPSDWKTQPTSRWGHVRLDDEADTWHLDWPLPNVWLGVSAEDQTRADERVPELLATPAAIRFVSAEPLLGEIDFTLIDAGHIGRYNVLSKDTYNFRSFPHGEARGEAEPRTIDWIIVGGESGNDARPMHPDWARQIRDQCAAAGTPFFFKQWGEYRPLTAAEHGQACGATLIGNDPHDSTAYVLRVGKNAAGRELDGVEHNGMPQPREVPAL